ncbi:hypothetical protein SMICM17S_01879 [Streptomyces microflavus]
MAPDGPRSSAFARDAEIQEPGRRAVSALTAVVSLAALSTTAPAATATGPVPSALPTAGPLSAVQPALGPLPVPLPPLPSFPDGGSGMARRSLPSGPGSP